MRMGVPVAPRNIFPSNIQGLPTWYEVRVTEAGHLGARGGVDLMVAMNPQTWDKDVAVDRARRLPVLRFDQADCRPSKFRDDITVIGVPLTAICNREYTDPRQRQLFKNIIYLGALSALLDMDVGGDREADRRAVQGQGQADRAEHPRAASRPRLRACINLECPIGLRVRKRRQGRRPHLHRRQRGGGARRGLWRRDGVRLVSDHAVLVARRGLHHAIASSCASIPETKKAKYAIVQAEDELASIGMVIGAAWNGARAFTATSGPGISLMQEFIGLAYFAEIPAVIFDVQRAGPSTGMPTRTQQCDIISCAYASHGDTKHVLLFPEDPAEAFEFGAHAFDLADRLQTPIFVMLDLDIGMNHRLCRAARTGTTARKYDRGKVMTAEELDAGKDFGRYLDVDGDGIPYRTYPGTHPTKGSFFTRGTSRDRYARYTEEGAPYVDNMQRLLRKFETAKDLVPRAGAAQCRQADANTA